MKLKQETIEGIRRSDLTRYMIREARKVQEEDPKLREMLKIAREIGEQQKKDLKGINLKTLKKVPGEPITEISLNKMKGGQNGREEQNTTAL